MTITKLGMNVSKIMTKNPVITAKDELLPRAARKMLSNNVGCLIVKEKGTLVGIVTEKDIVEGAVGKELDIKRTRVKDVMSTGMVTISPDVDILDAIKKMKSNDVRRLPVVKKKKLLGLLTMKDIVRAEPELLEHFRSTLMKKR